MDVEVWERDPTLKAGVVGRVLIVIFEGAPNAQQMMRLGDHDRAFLRRQAGPLCTLAVISPQSFKIDADARAVSASVSKELDPHTIAGAVVLTSRGVTGALQRSLITGIHLMSKVSHPRRVFDSTPEAAQWLSEAHQREIGDVSAQVIVRAVETLRRGA